MAKLHFDIMEKQTSEASWLGGLDTVPGVALCLVDDPAHDLAHGVLPALLLQGVPAHRDPLLAHLIIITNS